MLPIQRIVERPIRSENMSSKHCDGCDGEPSCPMMRVGITGGLSTTSGSPRPHEFRPVETNLTGDSPRCVVQAGTVLANIPIMHRRAAAAKPIPAVASSGIDCGEDESYIAILGLSIPFFHGTYRTLRCKRRRGSRDEAGRFAFLSGRIFGAA